MTDHTLTKKRSLGKLRILKAFENLDEVVCNIAAWVNHDHDGQYLTVELSPKYVAPDPQSQHANRLNFIFGNGEDHS